MTIQNQTMPLFVLGRNHIPDIINVIISLMSLLCTTEYMTCAFYWITDVSNNV